MDLDLDLDLKFRMDLDLDLDLISNGFGFGEGSIWEVRCNLAGAVIWAWIECINGLINMTDFIV